MNWTICEVGIPTETEANQKLAVLKKMHPSVELRVIEAKNSTKTWTMDGYVIESNGVLPDYVRIKMFQQEEGKRQMAFCAIYTLAKPYLDYQHVPKEQRGVEIPLVLMLMRWDGFIGFPGGNVDDGESLLDAAIREMREEINYYVRSDQMIPLCSLSAKDRNIHCFCHEVSPSTLKEIIADSIQGEHFLSENQGCFAVQIAEFEKGGLREFKKHNFKGSAGIELDILIEEKLRKA